MRPFSIRLYGTKDFGRGRITGKPEIMPDCGTNFRLADKPETIQTAQAPNSFKWLRMYYLFGTQRMRILRFGIIGMIVQAAALTGFILVSRTNWAQIGKAAVVSLAIIGIGLLLWREVQQRASGFESLCWLPVALSFGYLLAFHAVGAVAFPGLLRDSHFDIDFFWVAIHILVTLIIVYGIATVVLFTLRRGADRWHR